MILLQVALEGSHLDAMLDKLAQRAARADHAARKAVHFEIGGVADDEPGAGVEHAQALGHIVEGEGQALASLREAPASQQRAGDQTEGEGREPRQDGARIELNSKEAEHGAVIRNFPKRISIRFFSR